MAFNNVKDVRDKMRMLITYRLTFNVQMSDTCDLATRVTNNTLVDAGVGCADVEHHQSVVAVSRVVSYAILVRRAQCSVVVKPLARGGRG